VSCDDTPKLKKIIRLMETQHKSYLVKLDERPDKCDGFTNGSMACAEWLRSGRGGDLTTPEVHSAGHLVDFTAVGTEIHGNTTQEKHEETLCSQTWNTQGIPGRIPGDFCLGCK